MKYEFGFTLSITNDLDVGPVKVADTRAQGFGHCFLYGKATG